MSPFNLSLPPLRPKDSRKHLRRVAGGLSLTCTKAQTVRFTAGAVKNLALALKDVGRGGLGFVSEEVPEATHPLEIRIREDSTGTLLHAKGVVAWVKTRRVDGREVHDVGVRFQEILAPAETCARFLEGFSPTAASTTVRRRRMDRFGITDGDVVLEFDPRFLSKPHPGNLALGLVDLSRSGAQIVSREPLKPGDRVRLTVILRSFGDNFTAEASAIWVKPRASDRGQSWSAGLCFSSLDRSQERKLQTFERWFTQPEPE